MRTAPGITGRRLHRRARLGAVALRREAIVAAKISREHALELQRIRMELVEYREGLDALGERLDALIWGAHGPQSDVVPDSMMDAYWDGFVEEAEAQPEAVAT